MNCGCSMKLLPRTHPSFGVMSAEAKSGGISHLTSPRVGGSSVGQGTEKPSVRAARAQSLRRISVVSISSRPDAVLDVLDWVSGSTMVEETAFGCGSRPLLSQELAASILSATTTAPSKSHRRRLVLITVSPALTRSRRVLSLALVSEIERVAT